MKIEKVGKWLVDGRITLTCLLLVVLGKLGAFSIGFRVKLLFEATPQTARGVLNDCCFWIAVFVEPVLFGNFLSCFFVLASNGFGKVAVKATTDAAIDVVEVLLWCFGAGLRFFL